MSTYDERGGVIETAEARWRVLRHLGTGGMCAAYLVLHEGVGKIFVAKILLPKRARRRSDRHRFHREAKALGQLDSPHIVSCVHITKTLRGEEMMVLSYVDGMSVRELLDRDGTISLGTALRIAIDALDGLAHAHSRNVVHRDIKPANVIYRFATHEAVVLDLGIMALLDAPRITDPNESPCTEAYAAPEQILDPPTATTATDIHAVAVLIMEMITGDHPFAVGKASLRALLDAIRYGVPPSLSRYGDYPLGLGQILTRALAKDPLARPSASEFRAALIAIESTVATSTDGRLLDTRTPPDPRLLMPPMPPSSTPGGARPLFEATPPLVPSSPQQEPDTLPLGMGVLRSMRRAHPWAPLATALSSASRGLARTVSTAVSPASLQAAWPYVAAACIGGGVLWHEMRVAATGNPVIAAAGPTPPSPPPAAPPSSAPADQMQPTVITAAAIAPTAVAASNTSTARAPVGRHTLRVTGASLDDGDAGAPSSIKLITSP